MDVIVPTKICIGAAVTKFPSATHEKWRHWSETSLEQPRYAKEVKDELRTVLSGLVVEQGGIKDSEGHALVFMKFLNGRIGVLQPLSDVAIGESNLISIHHCTVRDLRQHWGTVGAGIAFGIGFVVMVNTPEASVEVVLRRAPGDTHAADAFAKSIFQGAIEVAAHKVHDADIARLERKVESFQEQLNRRLDAVIDCVSR